MRGLYAHRLARTSRRLTTPGALSLPHLADRMPEQLGPALHRRGLHRNRMEGYFVRRSAQIPISLRVVVRWKRRVSVRSKMRACSAPSRRVADRAFLCPEQFATGVQRTPRAPDAFSLHPVKASRRADARVALAVHCCLCVEKEHAIGAMHLPSFAKNPICGVAPGVASPSADYGRPLGDHFHGVITK